MNRRMRRLAPLALVSLSYVLQGHGESLPGTSPLTLEGDLAARMVEGIDRHLARETDSVVARRVSQWSRDFSTRESYLRSIEPNRARFREIIGLRDERVPPAMWLYASASQERLADGEAAAHVATGDGFRAYTVRWPVFRGVEGEGLLLVPTAAPVADVVALPDCDWTPEMLVGLQPGIPSEAQFARRLAESGCRVLVPFLIDRGDTYSGLPGYRHLRQPQREVLWRASYQMGRTLAGYEVQKVLAAAEWFRSDAPDRPVGVFGYGEGGLIAFYSAAAASAFDAVAISGYYQPRESLWTEPIYRNVWSLLVQFGDAEIAGLIAPTPLLIENGRYPEVTHPRPGEDHDGMAPGILAPLTHDMVSAEVARAKDWVSDLDPPASITYIQAGKETVGGDESLSAFLRELGANGRLKPPGASPRAAATSVQAEERLKRQYVQILEDTQHLMRESEFVRVDFWENADRTSLEGFEQSCSRYKEHFWNEIIGRLPVPTLPVNARSRLIYETDACTGYEVVLDVYEDVYAYGILTLPKNIQPGERRPVVVCQHGLEGRPQDVADPSVENSAYHQYAYRLAERGFVTFSPQNPYIGRNRFRQVLRRGQPIQISLYSFIVRQHERILEWLSEQPFTDPDRIAFYGLSYGGKTAMRVPPLLDRYCLAICSADYNEWIWKNVSARHRYSYLYTGEYDMAEFNMGNTFNYAELSWMIFPRPFMVERGHHDGVAPDEWVAYEYAKTRRFYTLMGLGDRTEIEFFDGPHTIHGVGTFAFLHRHLNWPEPD